MVRTDSRTRIGQRVTPIDDEHAALLKGLADNTHNPELIRAYSDWLQENGSPGWLIVNNWPIWEWSRYVKYQDLPSTLKNDRSFWGSGSAFAIPWLPGVVEISRTSHHLQRIKRVLTEYAEGRYVQ